MLRWIRGERRRAVQVEPFVKAELRGLRERLPDITGVLVATADGLLVAYDAVGIEPESVAAMSAAHLGLGQQMARTLAQGEFQETLTRAANGYVATFAAGTTALLTVLATANLNVGRLHHEARPVAARVGAMVMRAAHA